jgi:DNA processing protein
LKTGEKIAQELSGKFTVLTGVADGGDTAAIEGALKGSKRVICLLAGGYSSIPKGNFSLMRAVEEQGLLLAPNHFDVSVRAFSYERRNKLIALLSVGVLVLGAGEKSGSLITAKYAQNYQKPIFALPYPPLSGAGVGCNALIKQGARLTEEAQDVFDFYGVKADEKPQVELTEAERKVWQYLVDNGEAHLTQIGQAVGLPTYKVTAVTSALEMKGLVVKLGSNRFSAV